MRDFRPCWPEPGADTLGRPGGPRVPIAADTAEIRLHPPDRAYPKVLRHIRRLLRVALLHVVTNSGRALFAGEWGG